jgi:hypothetical protein
MDCFALPIIILLVPAAAIGLKAGGAITDKAGGGSGGAIIGSMVGSAIGAAIGVPVSFFTIAIMIGQSLSVATIATVSWWIPIGIMGIAGAFVGMIAGLIIGLIAEAFDVMTGGDNVFARQLVDNKTGSDNVVTRHSVIGSLGAMIGGVLSTLLCLFLLALFLIG